MSEHQLYARIDELQRLLKAAHEENAQLRYERDAAWAHVRGLIPAATPEQEEQMRQELEHGEWLDFSEVVNSIIVDMKGKP